MQNKRQYLRFGIASIARISFPDSDETIDAFISSLGQGGIGIYSYQRLEIGLDINIQITFLQTNGNAEITEIIPGRVAWVKEFQQNFVVGISFTTLDTLRHSNLLHYIEAASQGKA